MGGGKPAATAKEGACLATASCGTAALAVVAWTFCIRWGPSCYCCRHLYGRASVLVAACEASPGRGAGPQPGERHHTSKGARDGPLAQRRGANAIVLTLFPNLIANATRNKVGCWLDGTRG